MKVYVVSQICDDEYFCTEVLFVTASEEIAKEYCKKHSRHLVYWDDCARDTITYKEYKLVEEL